MPGYTHLQRAQPVLLSHYLLAYREMFDRDAARLKECLVRINVMPLGSAALAGAAFRWTGVTSRGCSGSRGSRKTAWMPSDRDFVAEFISAPGLS